MRAEARGEHTRSSRIAVAVVLGGLTVALVLSQLHGAASMLNQERRLGVGDRAGLEGCLDQSVTGRPLLPLRHAFVAWLRPRLPAHAAYALVSAPDAPDEWCVTLVLLPRLLAGPGVSPRWTIAFGTVTPQLQARILRRDPQVSVFAPGYALAREPG